MNDILKNRRCGYPDGYVLDGVAPGSADHIYLVFVNSELRKGWNQASLKEQADAERNVDEYFLLYEDPRVLEPHEYMARKRSREALDKFEAGLKSARRPKTYVEEMNRPLSFREGQILSEQIEALMIQIFELEELLDER